MSHAVHLSEGKLVYLTTLMINSSQLARLLLVQSSRLGTMMELRAQGRRVRNLDMGWMVVLI